MGKLSTIVSFGAGYTVGATKGSEPVRRATDGVIRWGRDRGVWPGGLAGDAQVRDVMTAAPETVGLDTSLTAAARLMAQDDIGDIIVTEQNSDRVVGIVTDRDITVRAVA
jgi:CBS domain-containing protein